MKASGILSRNLHSLVPDAITEARRDKRVGLVRIWLGREIDRRVPLEFQ